MSACDKYPADIQCGPARVVRVTHKTTSDRDATVAATLDGLFGAGAWEQDDSIAFVAFQNDPAPKFWKRGGR